jgi:hypothetical protein
MMTGCDDGEPVLQTTGVEYFPLRTGFYQIYTVDQTTYSEINPAEEISYELKVEMIDSFPNAEDGFTYVMHRSTRASEADPWQYQETWSARVNVQHIVLTEGNLAYIRIALPVVTNKEWNGNALNTLEEDFYNIESVGDSYQVSEELDFSDVLVVNQHHETNELIKDEREEVYAKHVGLIFKKSIVLNYCDEVPCFGQQIINDGVEYVQVLKEYGQH